MKIEKIKIHNWRSIKDLEINFQDMMMFIGQNNHGKSNVLSSLLFFFGVIPCADLDFNRGSDELYIEIIFSNLDDHDRAQFAKYVTTDNKILVQKRVVKGDNPEYHGYCQIPSEEWLKEENVGNYISRESINDTPLGNLVPPAGRLTKDIIKSAQETYISTNRQTLQFAYELETTNFLGLKNVAQGIFGEVYFVPAVKNASDEFSVKNESIFSQLLTSVINEMSQTNEEYIEIKDSIKALSKVLNKRIEDGSLNADRPKQLSQLEESLESELESWHTKIDIEIIPPEIDKALRLGTSIWVDDGVPTDVNRKGHGLQRALIFSLIKAWAKIKQEERDAEEETPRKASKSFYFIFEEPELYLHPQAQRELFASLKQLSLLDNQVLISTHSSSFIDLDMYKSICIMYKNDLTEGTKALQCTVDLFSLDEEKKRFNMTYWINPDRGELFFAKKVILMEGATDKTVISFLAKGLGIFRYDYTLIDCGSKGNIPIYIQLLNKFKLPYIAVYDRDHQTYKTPDGINTADTLSQTIENEINVTFGQSIILDNDIEEEIGIADRNNKHKPYLALEHISEATFNVGQSLENKIRTIFR